MFPPQGWANSIHLSHNSLFFFSFSKLDFFYACGSHCNANQVVVSVQIPIGIRCFYKHSPHVDYPEMLCSKHMHMIMLSNWVVVVVRLSAAPVRGRHSGSSVMIRILIWHRFCAGCPSWRNPGCLLQHRDKDWVSPWFRATLHPLIAWPSTELPSSSDPPTQTSE